MQARDTTLGVAVRLFARLARAWRSRIARVTRGVRSTGRLLRQRLGKQRLTRAARFPTAASVMLRTVRFMACRAARATACVNPRIPARMIAHAAAHTVAPEFSSTLCVFVHAMLLRHRVTPVREPLGPRFPCSSRLDPLVPLRPARRSTSKPRSLRTSRHSSCPSVPPRCLPPSPTPWARAAPLEPSTHRLRGTLPPLPARPSRL
jgi:hypothetical protein